MSGAIHMTRPDSTRSILDAAPLWCGRARSSGVQVTAFRRLATCRRCVRADARHAEDSEHRRTMRRLERHRALADGSIVSHSPGYQSSGTLCGEYSEDDDIDSSNVTCPACKARIAAAHERASEPTTPRDTTMTDSTENTDDKTLAEPATEKPPLTPKQELAQLEKLAKAAADAVAKKKKEMERERTRGALRKKLIKHAKDLDVTINADGDLVTLSFDDLITLLELDSEPAPAPKKAGKPAAAPAAKAPKKTGKKAAKKAAGKRTAAADTNTAEYDERILAKLRKVKQPALIGEIDLAESKKGTKMRAALRRLRDANKIISEGQARATKYSIAAE